MDINITIPDEQGAAMAQFFNITSYADGNDLMQQVANAAILRYDKYTMIARLAVEQDAAVVNAVVAAYNSIAATPLPPPPIRLK